MVGLPWEKVIDKKVKSSDSQDAGFYQCVSTYYLEAKEGHVRRVKNDIIFRNITYQGFDGENLPCTRQRSAKDEINRCIILRNKIALPSESEFETQEYEDREKKKDKTHTPTI